MIGVIMGIPAELFYNRAGTKRFNEFLFIIAIISSTDTLTIFEGIFLLF
jgi:hypothetical protein